MVMDIRAAITELESTPKPERGDPRLLMPKYRQAFLERGYDDEFGNLDALAQYAAHYRAGTADKGLCLIGAVGTGKTMAMRIFHELFARSTRFVTVNEIIADEKAEIDVIDKYGYCVKEDWQGGSWDGTSYFDVDLIIDDIGQENVVVNYGERYDVLSRLLFVRDLQFVEKGVKTFLTSNLSLKAIAKRYDARVRSRIEGMCNVVVMKGDDRRVNG